MSNPIVVLFIPDFSSSLKWSFHPPLWHITMQLGGEESIPLAYPAAITLDAVKESAAASKVESPVGLWPGLNDPGTAPSR